MPDGLRWDRDGADWPHREHSRFVVAGGLRWHVQQMGEPMSRGRPEDSGAPPRGAGAVFGDWGSAYKPLSPGRPEDSGAPPRGAGAVLGDWGSTDQCPVLLMIHGTGASTHSWRGLMPLLARHATVVAMDLPGHGFTGLPAPGQLTLSGMSGLVASLVEAMRLQVTHVIGHSAGAAIAVRMVLDGRIAPRSFIGINAALLPLGGLSGLLFPPVARLLAGTGFAPRLFAQRRWDRPAVERLIAGTGSRIDAQGLALYGRLLRDARHASGALGMMAGWDLVPLQRDLSRLRAPTTLIVGENDRAVPPGDAMRVRALLPAGTPCVISMLNGGHLVHEERSRAVADGLLAAIAA